MSPVPSRGDRCGDEVEHEIDPDQDFAAEIISRRIYES